MRADYDEGERLRIGVGQRGGREQGDHKGRPYQPRRCEPGARRGAAVPRVNATFSTPPRHKGIAWIKWIGTHKDYDKVDASTV